MNVAATATGCFGQMTDADVVERAYKQSGIASIQM